jgi:hypothetical protein
VATLMPSASGTERGTAARAAAPPRRRGRLLLWLALALVLGGVGLELGLRGFGGLGRRIQAIPDPRVGWRLVPGQDRAHQHDPTILETINDWGFRDRDWGPAPADGAGATDTLRVAVLGNSLTYGVGVRGDQTWPRRLEGRIAQALAERGAERDVVVMNFALPAFTVEQSLRQLEDVASRWEPELVILSLHPVDMLPMRPIVDSRTLDLPHWMMRTAIFEWLANDVFDFRPGRRRDQRVVAWQEQLNAMQRNPYAAQHRAIWQRSGDLIDASRRTIEARGGHLVVCMLPISRTWAPPFWASPMTYFDHWVDAQRAQDPDSSVLVFDPTEAFVEAQGALTDVILKRGFLTSPRNTPAIGEDWPFAELSLYLPDDFGHYSSRGHDMLASLVFAQLVAAELL